VNEWLVSRGGPDVELLDLQCECGWVRCGAFFVLSPDEYAAVRREKDLLFVVRDHLEPDATIVQELETVLVIRVRDSG
jgi:hypothetical protein